MKTRLIYCNLPERKTVTGFLKAGFSYERNGYSGKFAETFHDKECTKRECNVARRSLEDIIAIVNTRYGSYSPRTVARIMHKLFESEGIAPMWCPAIRKVVFIKRSKSSLQNREFTSFVADSEMNNKGNGEYSMNDIMELIKVKKRK